MRPEASPHKMLRFAFTGKQTPDHIFRRAQDIRAGQVVLPKGGRISPPHVAVLASVGCVQPSGGQAAEGGRYRQRRRTGSAGGTTGTVPDPELQRVATDGSARGHGDQGPRLRHREGCGDDIDAVLKTPWRKMMS